MRRGEALGLPLVRRGPGALQPAGGAGGGAGLWDHLHPRAEDQERAAHHARAARLDALRLHRARQEEQRIEAGPAWQDHDLIFPTRLGTPINPNNLARDYNRLIELAGVPRIRIHDQRHTYATLALERGANLLGVSRQLGHARPSTTSDLYAHVTAAMQQQVTDTMGDVLFGRIDCQPGGGDGPAEAPPPG